MATEGEYAGKIALVTGASRGIGQGIALALGRKGATVIGTATTQEGANRITQTLKTNLISGTGEVLNVTSADAVDAIIQRIKHQYGAINILVNNAAITRDDLLLRMKEEAFTEVIDTNLTAIYRLTKACIRDMIKARWGRIINIGSVVGSTGNAGQANYAAAKAGLIGLGKSIALEVASRGITVNTIAPGFIATDMTQALTEAQRETIFDSIPMQRMGEIEEIGAAVVFLASPSAGYITGQTLHINGGMHMA